MNAKKKLLGGMSLDGQAIPVGGIIPTPIGVGTIKVPRACPWGCFPWHRQQPIQRVWMYAMAYEFIQDFLLTPRFFRTLNSSSL